MFRKKRQIASVLLIVFVVNILGIMGVDLFNNTVFGAAQRITYSTNSIDNVKYPGYNELIEKVKVNYPNWTFTLLYTGLDWEQVIKAETTGHFGSPKSLITYSKTGEWICGICGTKLYDNKTWYCASEKTVAYMIDPRNSINTTDIFQFEELSYKEGIHTIEGIKSKTNNTFLAGDIYSQAIFTASKNANISPYYVVSRLLQEQGQSGGTTANGKMVDTDGKVYYNVFNVNATGNNSKEIIANALSRAKQGDGEGSPWDTLDKSILGGITFLKARYVEKGQNTLYLNKFDVDDTNGTVYRNQYMQNITAAQTEGTSMRSIYENTNTLGHNFEFVIPLYENMPQTAAERPKEDVYIEISAVKTNNNVNYYSDRGTTLLGTLAAQTDLLLIEESLNDTGFDKVVLPSGEKVYVQGNYLDKIEENLTGEFYTLTGNNVRLRNGPGTTGTSTITSLVKGQIVTVVEKNKYNVDGFLWDRVVLADGRQGLVANKYLQLSNQLDMVQIIPDIGLKLRISPGLKDSYIIVLPKGSHATRIEKGATMIDDYYWDKIVTSDGIIGYAARNYLGNLGNDAETPIVMQETAIPPIITDAQTGIKLDGTTIFTQINTTFNDVKTTYPTAKLFDKNGVEITDTATLIATGQKLDIDGTQYTLIKKGDVSGDGLTDARDSARILRASIGLYTLENEYLQAADINGDGINDARDSARILRASVGWFIITI